MGKSCGCKTSGDDSAAQAPKGSSAAGKNITEIPAVAGLIDQLEEKSTLTYSKNSITFSNMRLSEHDFLNLRIFDNNEWDTDDNSFIIKKIFVHASDTETNEEDSVSVHALNMLETIVNLKINKYIRRKKLEHFETKKKFSFTLNEAGVTLELLDSITYLLGIKDTKNKYKFLH